MSVRLRWPALRRSFTKFLLSYIVLLLGAVVAEMVVFSLLIRDERDAIVHDRLEALQASVTQLDERLRELEDIVAIISDDRVNPNIASLLRRTDPATRSDYFEYINTINRLPDYKLTNSTIAHYFIHLRRSRFILSPGVGSGREREFYESHLRYPGLTVESWIEDLYEHFHVRTYWPAQDLEGVVGATKYVTLLRSIPIDSFVGYTGTVIFLIDERQILSSLDTVAGFGDGGVAYILDRDGTLVASSLSNWNNGYPQSFDDGPRHTELQIGGQATSVVSVTSDHTGWTYAAAIPSNVFWRGMSIVRGLLLIVLLVTLAPGLVIAIVFSYRYSRAVQAIVSKLRGSTGPQPGDEDEYRFIESSVVKLVARSSELMARLEQEEALLQNGFFARLLGGGYFDSQEIKSYLNYTDVTFVGGVYSAALFRVEGYRGEISGESINELTMTSAVALNVLYEMLPKSAYCHAVEPGTVAVLYSSRNSGLEKVDRDFQTVLKRIEERLRREYGVRMSCGVGNVCSELLGVSTSYQQALRCLDRGGETDGSVVAYVDLSTDHTTYAYSVDEEVRLINLVKAGATPEVLALLSTIGQHAEGSTHQVSIEITQRLMNGIRHTLARMQSEVASTSDSAAAALGDCLDLVDDCTDPVPFFEHAAAGLERASAAMNETKRSHNDLLRERIVSFVDEHYADPLLNLAVVATEFNLAEKYLSKFFKEQTGENFSVHIENVRMERARDLLVAGEQPVSEIARSVGYGSANTFHRAFKRIYGVTSTEYRDSHRPA
jgi:two-component system, response regulator YesN